jgi:hypothetical protein
MVNRPKDVGTRASRTLCCCGCGEAPANYKAQYVRGHRPRRPLAERLAAKTVRSANGCLEWQGFINPAGYGEIGLGGREDGITGVHRAAWLVAVGEIPAGMFVCHTCDNRRCVEPTHLFLGTLQDNVDDMVRKGRQAAGSRLPHTKLTSQQVAQIRAMRDAGSRQRDIAMLFDLSQSYVSELCARLYRRLA